MKKQPLSIVVLAYLCLFGSLSCEENDVKAISKSLVVAANAIGEVQSTTMKATELNLMDKKTGVVIMESCLKVNQAGKSMTAIIRGSNELSPDKRIQIIGLSRIAIEEIERLIKQEVLAIKNPQTWDKVMTGLNAALAAMNYINVRMLK